MKKSSVFIVAATALIFTSCTGADVADFLHDYNKKRREYKTAAATGAVEGPKTPAVDTTAEVQGVWETEKKELKFVFESAADGHYCVGGQQCARFTWTLSGKQVTVIGDNGTAYKFRVENNKLHGTRDSKELVLSKSS